MTSLKVNPLPPNASWGAIRKELLVKWLPGEHFSIFGLTGSGKTVLELTLVNGRLSKGGRVVVLGTKPRDPVLSAWAKKHRAAIAPSLDKLR
jgi:ABC-type molybdenum transport system ATPase subunit/photorepair protein PhrA